MLKASTVTPKISATLMGARIGRTVSPCAENAAAKGSACSGFVGTPVDGPPRERMRFGVIAAGGKRALIAEHDPFALAREFFPNAFKNAFTREPEPAREQAKDDVVFREVRAPSLDRRLSHGHGQHRCRLDRKRDREGATPVFSS